MVRKSTKRLQWASGWVKLLGRPCSPCGHTTPLAMWLESQPSGWKGQVGGLHYWAAHVAHVGTQVACDFVKILIQGGEEALGASISKGLRKKATSHSKHCLCAYLLVQTISLL